MKKMIAAACMLTMGLTMGCTGQNAGYQSISAEEAHARMDRPDAVVIDVREPAEYKAGHVPGARLLPLGSIDKESAAAVIPIRARRSWYTAGAACAARRAQKSWQRWAMNVFQNSGAFCSGPMKWSAGTQARQNDRGRKTGSAEGSGAPDGKTSGRAGVFFCLAGADLLAQEKTEQ